MFVAVKYSSPVKRLLGDSPSECLVQVACLLDKEDEMGDDWRRLWPKLTGRRLDEEMLLRIRNKAEGPTMFTLKRWVQMAKSSEATVGKLMEALGGIYRNDGAEILEQYIEVGRHGN